MIIKADLYEDQIYDNESIKDISATVDDFTNIILIGNFSQGILNLFPCLYHVNV